MIRMLGFDELTTGGFDDVLFEEPANAGRAETESTVQSVSKEMSVMSLIMVTRKQVGMGVPTILRTICDTTQRET